jgi:hypothetical protein
MTKDANPMLQQFVFGVENGKPIGARFPSSEIRIFEIVKAKGLEIHPAYNDEWAALGMQLPAGRIYARGKWFIPPIKQALYEKLQATLANCKQEREQSQAERSAAATTAREITGGPDKAATSPRLGTGFPRTRAELAPGHLVLAQESLPDGWWEAVVVKRDNEVLTLQYRDYPKADQIKRTIWNVALLHVDAD